MSRTKDTRALPAVSSNELGFYGKSMLFFLLVGVLGLLQLWLQWGMASLVSKPPTTLPQIMSDGSIFFYSSGIYFATLYGILTFHDWNLIKPLILASFLLGFLLVTSAFLLTGIEDYAYYKSSPHIYPMEGWLFVGLQGVCAVLALLYASICTVKLENALVAVPVAPARPLEHSS